MAVALYINEKFTECQENPVYFLDPHEYNSLNEILKGVTAMDMRNMNPDADLDDLIFEEQDGGPSER